MNITNENNKPISKNENIKSKNEIYKDNEIERLKRELKEEKEKNKNLENIINELNNIKNKINNNYDDLVNIINPGEKAISALFISSDSKITYAITCKNTTPFVRIEEKLYEEYPKLEGANYYFICNGTVLKKFEKLEKLKIKSGDIIVLNLDENED